MQKVDHLEEEHPNCTDTTYEFSLSSEVPTGMLYDLVIEQVTSEDVWWIWLTRRQNKKGISGCGVCIFGNTEDIT